MENASKSLLIAGAILICILIVAIGMFIYNNSASRTNASLTSMSTQEIDAFNSQFNMFEGEQKGNQIKTLMSKLIGNANTYKDESQKVPQVLVDYLSLKNPNVKEAYFLEENIGDTREYIDSLTEIKNEVDSKHTYWVEINYQKNGLIDYILISYDGTADGSNSSSINGGGHLDNFHRDDA